MVEDGLDELAEHALHEALATREQVLQEGDVSAVGRQQQRHVGEVPDCGQGERCEGRGKELPAGTLVGNPENLVSHGHVLCILLHVTHSDEERRGRPQH